MNISVVFKIPLCILIFLPCKEKGINMGVRREGTGGTGLGRGLLGGPLGQGEGREGPGVPAPLVLQGPPLVRPEELDGRVAVDAVFLADRCVHCAVHRPHLKYPGYPNVSLFKSLLAITFFYYFSPFFSPVVRLHARTRPFTCKLNRTLAHPIPLPYLAPSLSSPLPISPAHT